VQRLACLPRVQEIVGVKVSLLASSSGDCGCKG
jgi:hypothetical protein